MEAFVLEELKALEDNQTWDFVDLPTCKQVVSFKWIFTNNFNVDGSLNRHKAWLVAWGFTQTYDIDYNET